MQFMDKASFMKKYRSEHSEIWGYLVMEIIFDVIGTIIIFMNTKDLVEYHSRYDEPRLIFFVFLGVFFWILGLIFLCLIKKVEANGNREYEYYLISYSENRNSDTPSSWICPKCGSYNEYSRLLCSKCSEPKPYVITRHNSVQRQNNNVNANSWICPNCGRQNQNYVGTCGCGEVKPK